jgi:rubrerythrin
MAGRRETDYDWNRSTPYKFIHNEKFEGFFNSYRAWVCRHCGIVKLEFDEAPNRWFCDICQLRQRLGTGPLGDKE